MTSRPRWPRMPLLVHPALGDNIAFERRVDAGAVDAAMTEAATVVEAEFRFARHTGVTLEARSIVADWNPGEQRLTVYQGTQVPHMMQTVMAKHLGLEEHQVRILCKDVGGSFGIKIHAYPDEMATAALSRLMNRPVAVRRRPAGKLRRRHPRPRPHRAGPHGGDAGRAHHRVRDR